MIWENCAPSRLRALVQPFVQKHTEGSLGNRPKVLYFKKREIHVQTNKLYQCLVITNQSKFRPSFPVVYPLPYETSTRSSFAQTRRVTLNVENGDLQRVSTVRARKVLFGRRHLYRLDLPARLRGAPTHNNEEREKRSTEKEKYICIYHRTRMRDRKSQRED